MDWWPSCDGNPRLKFDLGGGLRGTRSFSMSVTVHSAKTCVVVFKYIISGRRADPYQGGLNTKGLSSSNLH